MYWPNDVGPTDIVSGYCDIKRHNESISEKNFLKAQKLFFNFMYLRKCCMTNWALHLYHILAFGCIKIVL